MPDELTPDEVALLDARTFARYMIGRPMATHRLAIEWAELRSARHQDASPMTLLSAAFSWALIFVENPSLIEPTPDPEPISGGGF